MSQYFKQVSIIITAGNIPAAQIANRAISAAQENQWNADILYVAADGEHDSHSTSRFRSYATIHDALNQAKSPTVIVLDSNALIDSDQWRWAEKQLDHAPVQCIYWPGDAPARRLTKWMLLIFSLMSRLLFKHPVSALMPTALFIDNQPATTKTIIDSTLRLDPTNYSTWKIASAIRLDAGIKTGFHPASPAILLPPQPGTPAILPAKIRSRHVTTAFTGMMRFWFRDTMFPALDHPANSHRAAGSGAGKLLRVAACCVLLATSAAVLGGQLSYPLFEPDETRNAQLALNILKNDQWMALELNQEHYWDKPPLMAWATATSYRLFGVSAVSSRLPGVTMMMACVLVVFFAGKRIAGFRAAWTGAILALLSCGIPFTGRYLTMDSALTLFTTATILSAYIGSFQGRFRKTWWLAAGIFTGLGLLSKGPVILVVCLPPILLFSWLTGTPIFNKTRRVLYWAIPCLLVAGPWYFATMIATPEFILHFIWKHHVVRFTTAFNHQQPIWFYLPVILVVMFPASQLFLAAGRFLGTSKANVRRLRSPAQGFLVIFSLWVFGFFSFSQAKLPTYIFPAIPSICLLFASILEVNIFQRTEVQGASFFLKPKIWFNFCSETIPTFYRRLPRWLGLNMAFWIAITSVIMMYALPSSTASTLTMAWSVALTALVTAIACHRRAHPIISWSANCLLALFLTSLITHRIVPAVSQTRSIQNAVAEVKRQTNFSKIQVVYFGRDNFAPQVLLGDLPITHFPESETFRAAKHLQANPNSILVSTPDHIKILRKTLAWNVRIEKHPSARHVYLTSPDDQPLVRTAENIQSEKTGRR